MTFVASSDFEILYKMCNSCFLFGISQLGYYLCIGAIEYVVFTFPNVQSGAVRGGKSSGTAQQV